jgi:hypothetical protein
MIKLPDGARVSRVVVAGVVTYVRSRSSRRAINGHRRRGQHAELHGVIQFIEQVHIAPGHPMRAERLGDGFIKAVTT